MPRLEVLYFFARALHIAGGELDVGMDHLPSLRRVMVSLCPEKDEIIDKIDEAAAMVRLSAAVHPNRPAIVVFDFYLPTEWEQEEEE